MTQIELLIEDMRKREERRRRRQQIIDDIVTIFGLWALIWAVLITFWGNP